MLVPRPLRLLFAHRDFRLLWGDGVFNAMGMSGEQVVLSLLVFNLTGSSAWVGVVIALYFLPSLAAGILGGAIADWMDRRQLLRRCELALAIALGAFGLVLALGFVQLWQVLLMACVSGSLRAVYSPVRLSYAYDLVGVEHVVRGLGALNVGIRTGQLAGALAAGSAMQHLGSSNAYLIIALTYACGFVMLTRLRSAGVAAEIDHAPLGENLREYAAELRENRSLLALIVVMAAVGVFGFSHLTALPELAAVRFGVGAEGLGLMHAARAGGGILAALLLATVSLVHYRGTVLMGAILAFGLGVLMLSVAPSFSLAVATLTFIAAVSAGYDVLTQSIMQLLVPNHLRGRAMGAWVFVVGIEPLGHLELGLLAATLGVGLALQINAIALLLSGICAWLFVPRLRRL